MTLVYLVHDLADAAVARRVRMLALAGETPVLLGFRRSETPIAQIEGVAAFDLGRTEDARLGRRVLSVLGAAVRIGQYRHLVANAQVILARNLEMLVLAYALRARFALRARIVFECLDIHGSLVSSGFAGRLMRALERRMVGGCAGLIVSSPAFVSEHFETLGIELPPVLLVENKVLEDEAGAVDPAGGRAFDLPAAPWRIGWFGVLRCRRSLALLANLVRGSGGQVEVDLRGRPARNVIPDFDAVVAATPGLFFHGSYDRSRDLAVIYENVHFAWAMDFYEAGANSNWLLPNRLYEGGAQGAVAIAAASVETGRWLAARDAGVRLDEPIEATLADFMAALSAASYASLRRAAWLVPRADVICSKREAVSIAQWLRGTIVCAQDR